jgi:hypothetical protein
MSVTGSLVDPGCVGTLALLVEGPADREPYEAQIQQRMPSPSTSSPLRVGATVPVWVDRRDRSRVAVDLHGLTFVDSRLSSIAERMARRGTSGLGRRTTPARRLKGPLDER